MFPRLVRFSLPETQFPSLSRHIGLRFIKLKLGKLGANNSYIPFFSFFLSLIIERAIACWFDLLILWGMLSFVYTCSSNKFVRTKWISILIPWSVIIYRELITSLFKIKRMVNLADALCRIQSSKLIFNWLFFLSFAISFKNFTDEIKFHIKKIRWFDWFHLSRNFWIVDRMISSSLYLAEYYQLISRRDDNWFDNTTRKISICLISGKKNGKFVYLFSFVCNYITKLFFFFFISEINTRNTLRQQHFCIKVVTEVNKEHRRSSNEARIF